MSLIQANLSCPDCGSSRARAQYQDGWHCFKCKKTVKEETDLVPRTRIVTFPFDYTQEIPESYRWWYEQYGITHELVTKTYGFGYSPIMDRIIVPLEKRGLNRRAIARTLDNTKADKYRRLGAKEWIPFRGQVKNRQEGYKFGRSKEITLVLVEDCLSAIKIASALNLKPSRRLGHFEVWAILGTGNKQLINFITKLNINPNILIWLDGDSAGGRGKFKLVKYFNRFYNSSIINTEKDPKCYSLEEILEEIYANNAKL